MRNPFSLEKLRRRLAELETEAGGAVETVRHARDTLVQVKEARDVSSPVTADTVDELIKVSNPAHRQLLDAVANDEAINDCIYALGQALKNDQISTAVYLKKVRDLSRKQFVCRLLVNRIRLREAEVERAGATFIRQQSLP